MRTLFVDVDGVLADSRHRLVKFSHQGKLLPMAFFEGSMLEDRVIQSAQSALWLFLKAGWHVCALTSRDFDLDGRITGAWLKTKGFPILNQICVVQRAEAKSLFLQQNAQENDLFVDDFMGGYETGLPKFVNHVYDACRRVVRTEVFRNNWPEIVERYTGVKIDVRAI